MAVYRKLDVDDWDAIRRRYGMGESPRSLAAEYGVAESTLFRRRGLERWSRLLAPSAGAATGAERACEPPCEADTPDAPAYVPSTESAPEANLNALVANAPSDPAAQAISADHAATARRLRRKINQLLGGENLGASAGRQPQAVKDLAMALERLQKIERLALGLDDHVPERIPGVVIVIPAKLSPEEWERRMSLNSPGGPGLRIPGN